MDKISHQFIFAVKSSQENFEWLDAAELSKDLIGAMRWHSEKMYWFFKTPKLTDAYERILKQPFPGDAHDALADAIATVDLFNAMLE